MFVLFLVQNTLLPTVIYISQIIGKPIHRFNFYSILSDVLISKGCWNIYLLRYDHSNDLPANEDYTREVTIAVN